MTRARPSTATLGEPHRDGSALPRSSPRQQLLPGGDRDRRGRPACRPARARRRRSGPSRNSSSSTSSSSRLLSATATSASTLSCVQRVAEVPAADPAPGHRDGQDLLRLGGDLAAEQLPGQRRPSVVPAGPGRSARGAARRCRPAAVATENSSAARAPRRPDALARACLGLGERLVRCAAHQPSVPTAWRAPTPTASSSARKRSTVRRCRASSSSDSPDDPAGQRRSPSSRPRRAARQQPASARRRSGPGACAGDPLGLGVRLLAHLAR